MKISLDWLGEYLPGAAGEIGAERAAEALMANGRAVVKQREAALASAIRDGVTGRQRGLLTEAQGLVVRTYTQVNEDLLAKAPHLKVVGRAGVGLDNIDLPACEARHVTVFPATGANALAVAQAIGVDGVRRPLRGDVDPAPAGCLPGRERDFDERRADLPPGMIRTLAPHGPLA